MHLKRQSREKILSMSPLKSLKFLHVLEIEQRTKLHVTKVFGTTHKIFKKFFLLRKFYIVVSILLSNIVYIL